MSLPQATKEISAHPGKNSVTSPTVKADQDASVDQKLRLYGIVEAFRQGKLPDNQQIDETLLYVNKNSPIDEKKLSPEGRKLIADVRDVIETARLMIKEKNADELLQNFLHHTIRTEAEAPKVDTGVVPVTKEDLNNDGKQAVEHLRTLLSLILTNSEARKLLSDSSLIGRDLFARAAEKVRPDPEALARVDDAAPSDQFHSADGKTVGPNDTPVAQVGPITHDPKAPGNGTQIRTDPSDPSTARGTDEALSEAQSRARDMHAEATGTSATGNGGASEAVDRAQIAKDQASGTAKGEARELQAEVDNADTNEEKAEVAKRGIKDRLFGVKEKIPQEHRDRANEQYNKGVQFLKDEFPEERRDQFIYRLKKVVVECQKHSDYQEALTWFLGAAETYFSHGRTLADHHTGKAGTTVTDDPNLSRAGSELRTLLERFANGQSLDGIFDAANQLAEDAKNDEGLRNWFKELDTYVRKTLLEPGYIISPQCNNEASRLQDTGREFFDVKYRAHKDNLFDQLQAWFVAWSDDPINKRFGTDWKRLTKDLLFAEDGSLAFKAHLWTDIRKVIAPALIHHVGYIPIPRVEYTDNSMDLVIENLTLQGENIIPNIISLEAHNFVEFSPYDNIPDRDSHDFKFTFSQIQADMRDVAFYFNRKTGPVKLKDSGLADVFLGGEGLTVTVHLIGAGKDSSSVFHVKDVSVKVDSLKFSVRDTKHDMLYKTLKPLATGLVKKQISRAIEGAVRTGLEFLDEQLVGVRDRMAEARKSDDQSSFKAMAQLFDRKVDDATSIAASKKSKTDAQFKVVSKRDSVLIPQGHESGWINKQAEREAAAKTGDGWKSPAFSIVPGTVQNATPAASTIGTTGKNA